MKKITYSFGRFMLGMLFISVPMLASCSPPTEIDWNEEVKLHDGKIIVIKRHEELGRSGLPLAKRGARKFWEFCYAPMNIHWKSKPGYFPEVFDIVDGKAYVRVTISSCEQCMFHGYPETSALYFTWTGGAWKQISHKEFPSGLRLNILGNTHYDDDGTRDVRGLVTIKQKEHRDAAFYRLMRQRPEVIGRNDSVTYNGANKPPTYARDACKKCKSIRVQSDRSPEVFLPAPYMECK